MERLRNVKSAPIPSFVYMPANVLAAVLFGMAHQPQASAIFGGLMSAVEAATIVPNALYGI